MSPARSDGTEPQRPPEQKQNLAPQNPMPPKDEAVSKLEEILAELKRTGRPVINDPTVIINTKGTQEIVKGHMQPAYLTMEGPAMGNMNKLGDRRLARTVAVLGRQVNRVKKVRACVRPGTKIVFFWETVDEDQDGIDVKRQGTYATINFAELLIPEGLSIESGHYQKFALEFSEPTDAVYPALKFDMAKIVESGLTSEERKRRAEAAGEVAPKTKKNKKGEAPEPDSAEEE